MKKSFSLILFVIAICNALRAADAVRLEFDFAQSDHGFVAGFADLPGDYDPALYRLANSWQARPANLGGAPALFISGTNRSDDLIMYWKKRLTGLPPKTKVMLTMEIQLASKYAEGLLGVGGAPGEDVKVKAGAVHFEPQAVIDPRDGYWRMNLNMGYGGDPAADMPVIGNVAKPADGNVNYVLLLRHQHGTPRQVTTAADGSLWVIFATDSGFEGQTSLYYTRLTVWINRADTPHLWLEPDTAPGTLRLIWNQGTLLSNTTLGPDWPPVIGTTRPYIYNRHTEPRRFWRVSQP
jgi:hypothetical protein